MIIGIDHGKLHNDDAALRDELKNEVIFSAAAGKGLTLGKTVINFSDDKQKKGVAVEHIIPGETGQPKLWRGIKGTIACRKAPACMLNQNSFELRGHQ